MTAATETRKRTREDEGCDSMPLSKRINNLHINNNSINFCNDQNNASNHVHENGEISYHHQHNGNGFGIGQVQIHQQMQPQQSSIVENFYPHSSESNSREDNIEQFHNNQHGMMTEYSPELDQDQNPYYYNKNKLLFELHTERLRRSHN